MNGLLLGSFEALLLMQAAGAAITGTVRDGASGEPLAGAVVTLPDLGRSTVADDQGRYLLAAVSAGPHHLTVRFLGYAPRTLHALVPRTGELTIHVSLEPQAVPLSAVVMRARPPVAVRGAEHGDVVAFPDRGLSIAALRNHPLLAEPDALEALGGGEVVLRPESHSGIHVRGGAADQTAFLLDGIPVFSPYHAAGVVSGWNPDALAGLSLSSASPSPADPDALSGTVAAVTRTPGARAAAQGGASSTHARLTLDGPLGMAGAAYLVSLRSGFPSGIAPGGDSYLRGETGDRMAKLEVPAFGGLVRLLGYDSENEMTTAAAVPPDSGPAQTIGRNLFEWGNRSLGASWNREVRGTTMRATAWSATGSAGSGWTGQDGPLRMSWARSDHGLLASVERHAAHSTAAFGIRVQGSRTSYEVESVAPAAPLFAREGRTTVAAVFARHSRELTRWLELDLAGSLAASGGQWHLGPRSQVRWRPAQQLTVSASYARLHQFAQSLRNTESVVGAVFPVDLFLGSGVPGVPVASSRQGVLAADYRPLAGVRVGVQAYARSFDGLVLVAPRAGDPFATGAFAVGSGEARGMSLDAAFSSTRVGAVATYGLQRVRYRADVLRYAPDHGTTHLVEGGVITFPSATTSIRLGATGALGRHTTAASGALEWESCNLLDRGCEFSGSPRYTGMPLGAAALPSYLRVDVGVRKHWHLTVGGRDASVALFGTVTNVLGRRNVMTYAADPRTGALTEIGARPLAPLVVGLDWRF
jgi:hypothetical protein